MIEPKIRINLVNFDGLNRAYCLTMAAGHAFVAAGPGNSLNKGNGPAGAY
jgi:hypothetical protein